MPRSVPGRTQVRDWARANGLVHRGNRVNQQFYVSVTGPTPPPVTYADNVPEDKLDKPGIAFRFNGAHPVFATPREALAGCAADDTELWWVEWAAASASDLWSVEKIVDERCRGHYHDDDWLIEGRLRLRTCVDTAPTLTKIVCTAVESTNMRFATPSTVEITIPRSVLRDADHHDLQETVQHTTGYVCEGGVSVDVRRTTVVVIVCDVTWGEFHGGMFF